MKKLIAVVLTAIVMGSFTVGSAIANDCGTTLMPVKIAKGVWFVSNDAIDLMDGDSAKAVTWKGDKKKWRSMPVEKMTRNGVIGVKVSGTGPDFYRWILYQKGAPNNGWLKVEKLVGDMESCGRVYFPGKKALNGKDWNGDGPSFWLVKQ